MKERPIDLPQFTFNLNKEPSCPGFLPLVVHYSALAELGVDAVCWEQFTYRVFL
jgi:hypothetical protein